MPDAVKGLTAEILGIEANGDRAAAAALLAHSIPVRPEILRLLELGATVPIDVAPRYVTAEELVALEEPAEALVAR